jgi:hypothetical protein
MRMGDIPPSSRRAGAIGAIGLVACAIGAFVNKPAFFQAWLVTWLFLLGIALASMACVMIHELTGGEWGLVLRRALEAAMATMPLVALFAVPLAFGLTDLFSWARPDAGADAIVRAKHWFLNTPAFIVRNAAWLALWNALAFALRRRLASGSPQTTRRLAVFGLLAYLVTVTIASIDWIASLVPQWYSTAVGLRVGTAQFVAAFGFAVPFAVWRARRPRDGIIARARDWQDLGNLLLTFAMTWAYIAFTQYLIVWGEDLPHETAWFVPRAQSSWRFLAIAVVTLEFAVPTIAMLFRSIKRNRNAFATVCALALVGAWLDALWLVAPSLRPAGFELHVLDIAALVAEGGFWLAVASAMAERLPPARPRMRSEELAYG